MRANDIVVCCLGAFLLTEAEAGAADLKVWYQPVSERVYETIDVASVKAEALEPDSEWLYRVHQVNPLLAEAISVRPVASIEVRFREPEEATDSEETYAPLIEAGRKCAARYGANVIYMSHSIMEDGLFVGIRLIAYRAQYNDWVIPPQGLAGLTQTAFYDQAFIQETQLWNNAHFGRAKASEEKVVDFLKSVKGGAPVRLVLRDGSDVNGSFSGVDSDDDIWIRPEGFLGAFMDHSFHPEEVHSVALLN